MQSTWAGLDAAFACMTLLSTDKEVADLMLWPNPLHIQGLGQFIQATMEICAELHQVFDVIDDWKVYLRGSQ